MLVEIVTAPRWPARYDQRLLLFVARVQHEVRNARQRTAQALRFLYAGPPHQDRLARGMYLPDFRDRSDS